VTIFIQGRGLLLWVIQNLYYAFQLEKRNEKFQLRNLNSISYSSCLLEELSINIIIAKCQIKIDKRTWQYFLKVSEIVWRLCLILCEHSFKIWLSIKSLISNIDSIDGIELLETHELYLFRSRSIIISWRWMSRMDLVSWCCRWIMFVVTAGVIVLSLIPLYLPERNIDAYNPGMLYSHQLIFFFTQNLSLFRHGPDRCVLRHKFGECKFINSHKFSCHS
jgi:hypothetical protein